MMFTLFRKASDQELKRLESLSDRSISIAAAWELTRRALLEADERGVSFKEPIERFIRFTEDRLGETAPARWADGFRGAVVTDQKAIVFPTAVGSELYRDLSIDATLDGQPVAICGSISPAEVGIVAHPQGLAMRSKGEVTPLNRQLIKHLCYHNNRSTILHSKDGIFAALYTQLWHPYRVLRLDDDANEHPWQCRVWAGGSQVTAGGSGFYHFVTMVERDQELFVYGVTYLSGYVEGFRKRDGVCILRFGTFWGELPPRLGTSRAKREMPTDEGPTR